MLWVNAAATNSILSFAKTRPDAAVTLRRVHNGREDLRVVGSG
jgi:hypothetical protein